MPSPLSTTAPLTALLTPVTDSVSPSMSVSFATSVAPLTITGAVFVGGGWIVRRHWHIVGRRNRDVHRAGIGAAVAVGDGVIKARRAVEVRRGSERESPVAVVHDRAIDGVAHCR